LEECGQIAKNSGYSYYDEESQIHMREYNVDTMRAFDDKINSLPFGGQLSVHRPRGSRVVVFVGQDEANYKRFLFLTKMWIGPNGERPLLPKDEEGTGVMVSAFICREYGLIRKIDDAILAAVNIRRQGRKYADEEAAEDIYGTTLKQLLVSENSPFLVLFEYGKNKEGYRNYNKMVLQLEDAVDVLQVMHPDFDFVLF
jgi:hypothetical protein